MKDKLWIALALLAILLLAIGGVSALAEDAAGDVDDWTVLCYFCGSDLESKYSYATGNLEEIRRVSYPETILSGLTKDDGTEAFELTEPGKVNILIETGGAREWHADKLGLDIDAGALQRWCYGYYSKAEQDTDGLSDGYELLETLPLQSMADPQTLADFIRWGVETRPAKKYALVLWDHGGGAKTGLFIDELFDNDVMYLYELKQAMADGGAQFEAVVIDACMMANLETAWSIKDSARWLVASEEIVPGKGTAIGEWLQQLIDNPSCDGRWLGRTVCDETLIKYANEADEQSRAILTWSVIDLSKIDPLIEVFERFFETINDAFREYPWVATLCACFIFEAEEYGAGQENMHDLADVAYSTKLTYSMDLGLRSELLNTLSETIVYSVRGPGRSGARGLSFCYPTDFDVEEMDIYAKNFPMPNYLAYLDAINDWKAPGWVYEQVEPVPDVDTIASFRIKAVKRMSARGMPGLDMYSSLGSIDDVCYRLYRLDPETGEVVRLGRTDCGIETWGEDYRDLFTATDPTHWPSVDGVLFCMDLVQSRLDSKLYNVPVQLDSQNSVLRCGRVVSYSEDGSKRLSSYTVYGLWEGYDEHSDLLNRSVEPLSALAGQEYRFLYPVDGQGDGDEAYYQLSQPMTMYRSLEIEEIPLPEGTYYLEYEVDDIFMRPYLLDRIEFYWDGENMTFPEGFTWEGEIVLNNESEQ